MFTKVDNSMEKIMMRHCPRFFNSLLFGFLILVVGCTTVKPQEPRTLNAFDTEFLQTDFKITTSKHEVNPYIVKLLSNGHQNWLANPGEECNLSCLIDLKKPGRCLILAGSASNMAFMVYMSGTIAIIQDVFIVKFDDTGDILRRCSYPMPGNPKTLEELKEIFKSLPNSGICK